MNNPECCLSCFFIRGMNEITLLENSGCLDKKASPCLPTTVNLHFISHCNAACKYCFAGFDDLPVSRLQTGELIRIIKMIAAAPLPPESGACRRKINFVGGEPTLAPDLPLLVRAAKEAGLITSIVSNGFSLINSGLKAYAGSLDLLGLSIDSLSPVTNKHIGRTVNGHFITQWDWMHLVHEARDIGIGLKINTVVNRFNLREDMSGFIIKAAPVRWKVFQVMPVEGQNMCSWINLEVSDDEFQTYLNRHRRTEDFGIELMGEPNELMRGSYAMISPDGRFFDSITGAHRYSEPILNVGMQQAFAQVSFSSDKFNRRNGGYDPLAQKQMLASA